MSQAAVPARRFLVSWEQFHLDCRALARHLESLKPFSAIVSVTRGGLVPAAIIARELSIRVVETISIASYQGETVQETAQILKPISPEFVNAGGERILVIDDLVDTGQTARIVRQLLPRAHYACVYAKPAGRPLVDSFITEVSQDTWIYFPWDLGLAIQDPIVPASGS